MEKTNPSLDEAIQLILGLAENELHGLFAAARRDGDMAVEEQADAAARTLTFAEPILKALPSLMAACRMVCDRWQPGDLALADRACRDALAEAGEEKWQRYPVLIQVRGGVVIDVSNLPPGCEYEVKDWDVLEDEKEENSAINDY